MKDLWNKDRLGDQHQKIEGLSGKGEGRRSTSKAFAEKNEKIREVQRGRAAPKKREEKGRKWWRRKEGERE